MTCSALSRSMKGLRTRSKFQGFSHYDARCQVRGIRLLYFSLLYIKAGLSIVDTFSSSKNKRNSEQNESTCNDLHNTMFHYNANYHIN